MNLPVQPAEITQAADGKFSARITITMSDADWQRLKRYHAGRAMACYIGLDTPQIEDFLAFQVFEQIKTVVP